MWCAQASTDLTQIKDLLTRQSAIELSSLAMQRNALVWAGLLRLAAAAFVIGHGLAQAADGRGSRLVGSEFSYTVQPDDYLTRIGARYGIAPEVIARENVIASPDLIFAGTRLALDNRHLAPARRSEGIVINVAQRLLFLFQDGVLQAYYPVGLGRADWPTPLGKFRIVNKQENKEWCVPPSIQAEMREQGRPVREVVPPGPDNPLGAHWMGLDRGGIGLHATIAPASVYQFRSHGCIRLHPDDAAELYQRVAIGMRVNIIYEPVLLALLKDGRIFAEVHEDIYARGIDLEQTLRDMLRERAFEASVEAAAVDELLRLRDGIARQIGVAAP
jgi:L,D-transpeptidase ErfK/SrfK